MDRIWGQLLKSQCHAHVYTCVVILKRGRWRMHQSVNNCLLEGRETGRGGELGLYRYTFQCCLACCKSHCCFLVVWKQNISNFVVKKRLSPTLLWLALTYVYILVGLREQTSPWRVSDPQSRALAACVGFDHHLPSARPCREQCVPLAPYLFNTNKEKKMSSLNTFAALVAHRGMCHVIWVALCLWLHSRFLISGVINTEKRMKRDMPQPVSQEMGEWWAANISFPWNCPFYVLFSLPFFLAVAGLVKPRWQSQETAALFVLWLPSINIPAVLTELSSRSKEGILSLVQGVL